MVGGDVAEALVAVRAQPRTRRSSCSARAAAPGWQRARTRLGHQPGRPRLRATSTCTSSATTPTRTPTRRRLPRDATPTRRSSAPPGRRLGVGAGRRCRCSRSCCTSCATHLGLPTDLLLYLLLVVVVAADRRASARRGDRGGVGFLLRELVLHPALPHVHHRRGRERPRARRVPRRREHRRRAGQPRRSPLGRTARCAHAPKPRRWRAWPAASSASRDPLPTLAGPPALDVRARRGRCAATRRPTAGASMRQRARRSRPARTDTTKLDLGR